MSIQTFSSVYTDTSQRGTAAYFSVEESQRYTAVPSQTMTDLSLLFKLSSATVNASNIAGTTMILFQSAVGSTGDYSGPFLQLTHQIGATSPLFVNSFPAPFDNSIASMLLVATNTKGEVDPTVSVRSLFEKGFRESFDRLLSGSPAQRSSALLLTSHMFPVGFEGLDPSLSYVRIIQPLNVALTAWPDYAATVAYHILFFLDGEGHLHAQVARWNYWVEDGVKHDEIARQLEEHVKQGVGILNTRLAEDMVLSKLSGVVARDLYLMPGAPPKTTDKIFTANTYDDVTLVLPFGGTP